MVLVFTPAPLMGRKLKNRGDFLNKIYVLLGASGSGKSTLAQYLRKKLGIKELISHTTRQKRKGETAHYPYHFVDENEFKTLNLIEQVSYAGNYYGLSEKEVKNSLKNNDKIFVIMEKHGIGQLKDYFPEIDIEIVYIYATIEECLERMKDRRKEEVIERVKNSIKDKEFDNHDIADYIIRNKDLDKAKKQIKCIFS